MAKYLHVTGKIVSRDVYREESWNPEKKVYEEICINMLRVEYAVDGKIYTCNFRDEGRMKETGGDYVVYYRKGNPEMIKEENNGRTMTDEELEKKLKPYVIKLSILTILQLIGVGVIIIALVIAFVFQKEILAFLLIVGGAALLISALLLSGRIKGEYDSIFLQEMGPELENIISSYIGPALEQDTEAAESRVREEIGETNLIDHYNQCYVKSYRKGNRKGQIFEAFNSVMKEKIVNERKEEDGTIKRDEFSETRFDGTWLILQLKEEITAPIVIREVKDRKERKNPYWNVHPEDQNFDSAYCIHSDDPYMAYELLTPLFTEQLMNLADFAGAECGFYFSGEKMYLAVHGGERFLDMNGASTEHISDLKKNLRASLEHTCGLLDCLLKNGTLFGA